jgi:two-component system, NarL family, sensor histidine kinase UhpB
MTATTTSHGVKIASVFAAILASYFLLEWMDIPSSGIADLRVHRLKFATSDSIEISKLSAKDFVEKSPPFYTRGTLGVARLEFTVVNPATAGLALYIRRVRDNYAVYVNGHLAASTPGTLLPRPTLHGVSPRIVKLLPALLVPGKNTIDIRCARNLSPPIIKEIYFGPAARLEPAYKHTEFIMVQTAEFAALAATMVLLFAFALSSIIKNPALVLTIALTLAFFFARELHVLWVNVAWPQQFRDAYLMFTACGIWMSCAAFVNEWTHGPATHRRRFSVALVLAWLLVLVCYASLPVLDANAYAALVESAVEILAFVFMTKRLVEFYAQAPTSAWGEIFAATACLIMAISSIMTQTEILPGMSELVSVQGEAFVQFGALSIIAFIALGLARHGVGVYQLAALNNEALTDRVSQKERELAANYAILRAQEAERTLIAERGRIMSDVHDGIGSQLLGLLIQARSGKAKSEHLVEGLQSALDDLYLVVDSLDTVEGSLETALGTFRARVEPKCTAAGVSLIWNMGNVNHAKVSSPTTVLQICRILQEALSNAIHHGKATQITFNLATDAQATMVSLADNGAGFDPNAPVQHGRGLTNMRKRAQSIGADLKITSDQSGTRIDLKLPA